MSEPPDERYESIPWDALVTDDAKRRRRWVMLASMALVALAVGVVIGRNVWWASNEPTSTSAPGPVETIAPSTPSTVPDVEAPQALSTEETAAMSYAAWFVADYFTVDGSDVTRQSVLDRLPPGVDLPEPPDTARSFVESVFPMSVEQVAQGRYRVLAVVRALAASDGSSYRRQPARAVAVMVDVGQEGAAIVDLPRPAPLPEGVAAGFDLEQAEPPQVVVDAARTEAELWGTPVGAPISSLVGDAWRVVHLVEDTEGLVWPVAGWFDESGVAVAAGG